MSAELISVVIPVYNEGENIQQCLRGLAAALRDVNHELLVCYDFDADTTLPAIAAMPDRPATVRLVKNDLGKGVANALRAGFRAAQGDVVVTTMADLSDPPSVIPEMARRIRAGAAVVSGSRYMRGGSQTGGPRLKTLLSRAAGLSLCWIAGMRTHDATTNFRAYSRRFLDETPLESTAGFEVALELTVKAHLDERVVDEVASSWTDRTAGESRFQLKKWLPKYLHWYLRAMVEPAVVWAVWLGFGVWMLSIIAVYGIDFPYWDEFAHVGQLLGFEPVTLEWLWSQHNEHRIPLARLLWIGLFRATDGDYRAPMFVAAAFLISAGFAALLALRHRRGRLVLSDVALPVIVMNLGHAENLLWAHQVLFAASSAALVWILALASIDPARLARQRLRDHLIGVLATSLVFWGGQGAVLVPALAAWMMVRGLRLRSADTQAARRWLAWGGVAAACFALYLVNYAHSPPAPGEASLATKLSYFGRFMSTALSIVPELWPGIGRLTLACWLLGVGALALNWRRMPWPVRDGLVAILVATLSLGIATSHGRAVLGVEQAFAMRYITLTAPSLCALYFAAALATPKRGAGFVTGVLALLVTSTLTSNIQRGMDHARSHAAGHGNAAVSAASATNFEEFAASHPELYPDRATLAVRLGQLSAAKASIFAPGRGSELRRRYLRTIFPMLHSVPIAIEGKVQPLGDSRDAFVMVHAPGAIIYEREAGTYRLTAAFGIHEQTYAQPTGDGVTFRVVVREQGGEQVLFERHLAPRANESDRGHHQLDVVFTTNGKARILLQTLPGPAGDVDNDWSMWSIVRLRRR